MNPFNKTEAIGIFVSIAIMAVALSVMRFQTGILATTATVSGEDQSAVVAVSQDSKDDAELAEALKDSLTPSGELVKLVKDDVLLGSGVSVVKGDTLTVHYIGTTQDGVKFDSSYDRGQPFTFTVGEGRVIAGWEEGLIGMKVGGHRVLVIPSDMAYGNRQVGIIPPNTPLIFAVELLSVD